MKTFISGLAIAATIVVLGSCTKSQMPFPTDPKLDAPQASRQLDTNQHVENTPFYTPPVKTPRFETRP